MTLSVILSGARERQHQREHRGNHTESAGSHCREEVHRNSEVGAFNSGLYLTSS